MVDSPVPSEHSSEPVVFDGWTEEQIRELKSEAAEEANAFRSSMEHKLARLRELLAQDFNVDIQPGNPDLVEFRRLSETRGKIIESRDTTLQLNDVLQHQTADFDAYRLTLPASKPNIRPAISKRYNQCMAEFRLNDRCTQAKAHADRMTDLLQTCDENLETLRALVDLARAAATSPPAADAAPAADAPDADAKADDASADETDHIFTDERPKDPPKTTERDRVIAEGSSTKTMDRSSRPPHAAADEFGDSTPPHSEARLHGKAGGNPPTSRSTGSESIFGPFRSDAATSSSSPSHAPSTPLAFTAVGTRLLPTKDTGPDFSLYGSNPFYVNSSVKLPIAVDYTISSTKEPIISQTQLPMLSPETFSGNFLLYPKFRDAFIRLVHAPGRHMSDADRLRYLVGSLRGPAQSVVAAYTTSHGEGQYHHVTAALETRYYQPFQACRVLHKVFLDLRPKNATATELTRFADETIATVRLLRDYNDDLTKEKLAVEAWMEKIPHSVRLEMCRFFEPTSHLSLEEAVRTLQKYTSWQLNASLFADTCGLGPQFKSVTSGLKAILAPPHSSGPLIEEMKDDRAAGFFGNPKGYLPLSEATCSFCGRVGAHWPSHCPYFPTPSDRRERADKLNLCHECLRKNHQPGTPQCRAQKRTCKFCRKTRHQRALCDAYHEWYLRRKQEGSSIFLPSRD